MFKNLICTLFMIAKSMFTLHLTKQNIPTYPFQVIAWMPHVSTVIKGNRHRIRKQVWNSRSFSLIQFFVLCYIMYWIIMCTVKWKLKEKHYIPITADCRASRGNNSKHSEHKWTADFARSTGKFWWCTRWPYPHAKRAIVYVTLC